MAQENVRISDETRTLIIGTPDVKPIDIDGQELRTAIQRAILEHETATDENMAKPLMSTYQITFSSPVNVYGDASNLFKSLSIAPKGKTIHDIAFSFNDKTMKNLNTDNVTNMHSMFAGCQGPIDISNINTAKTTNMACMFMGCKNMDSIDISKFDMSKATDIHAMFACSDFKQITFGDTNTTNVKDMSSLFAECSYLENVDISKLNTSNTTKIAHMFLGCKNLETIDVSNLDTRNITDMQGFCMSCESLKELDLSNLNARSAAYMNDMFRFCESLEKLSLPMMNPSKDTAETINATGMFEGCSALKELNVSNMHPRLMRQCMENDMPWLHDYDKFFNEDDMPNLKKLTNVPIPTNNEDIIHATITGEPEAIHDILLSKPSDELVSIHWHSPEYHTTGERTITAEDAINLWTRANMLETQREEALESLPTVGSDKADTDHEKNILDLEA